MDRNPGNSPVNPDDELTAAILATANGLQDEMVQTLQQLVRIPSLTGEEAAVQDAVAAIMRRFALTVDRWEPDAGELAPFEDEVGAFETLAGRPNVVGAWPGAGSGRSLILNAHIDTVETGNPALWTHDPFGGDVDDGRVYGRGSCDMKAGLVANLYAVRILQQLGYRPLGDVIVESVISEEDGGAGTVATILRGYRADAVIITEPTRLAIVPAQGGSLVFRIHVPGRSAHAAVRDEGVSAIEKAWVIHQALLDYERERNDSLTHPLYAPIANKIPINIGNIRAGNWPSSVPEFAVMEGRAGLVPGEDLQAFKAEFAARIQRAAAEDPWMTKNPPQLEWFSGQFAPADVPLDSPIIGTVSASHQAVTGVTPPIEAVTYGADMRHLINQGGMPCVMYGPGDVRLAHYTDEFVPIAELLTVAATLARAISEWCGLTR